MTLGRGGEAAGSSREKLNSGADFVVCSDVQGVLKFEDLLRVDLGQSNFMGHVPWLSEGVLLSRTRAISIGTARRVRAVSERDVGSTWSSPQ